MQSKCIIITCQWQRRVSVTNKRKKKKIQKVLKNMLMFVSYDFDFGFNKTLRLMALNLSLYNDFSFIFRDILLIFMYNVSL